MENQPLTTGKFTFITGLILAAISLVFNIMLYSMDMHYQRNWILGIVGLLITAAVLVIAIYQFKKANSGLLSLGQALKIGTGAALIASIIAVLYQYVLANFIDPDFAQKVLETQTNQALEKGKITADQVQQQIEMGKKFFWISYPFALLLSIFIGFVLSLIAGLFMKKAPKAY